MIPGDLNALLAQRRKYVEEHAQIATGSGDGNINEIRSSGSKFAGMVFVPKSESNFVGLVNQGATCYLNSLLQAWYLLPEFRKSLLDWEYNPDVHGEEEDCSPLQLQRLYAQLLLSERGAVLTNPLSLSFGWRGTEQIVQHDIQECLSVLYDHFYTVCDPSPFHDHLASHQGELSQNLACHNCNVTRSRTEGFRELQLFVRDVGSVPNALDVYFGAEELDGVECDSCGGKHTHTKFPRLQSLPYILTIQLMRFDLDYNTFQRVKLNDPMRFERTMDLKKYRKADKREEGEGEEEAVYELAAIFMHTGSAHSGHYFVYGKDFSSVEEDRWVNLNDSHSSILSEEMMDKVFNHPDETKNEEEEEEGKKSNDKTTTTSEKKGMCGAGNTRLSSTKHKRIVASAVTNAYMLMYRRVDPDLNRSSIEMDEINPTIRDWINEDNKRYLGLYDEWEYERSFLNLKFLFGGKLHLIRIHQDQTVKDFEDKCFESIQEALAEDGVEDRSRVRMRIFDSIKGVLMGSLGEDDMQLKEIPEETLRKPNQFEIRAEGEEFEDYMIDGMPLNVSVYDPAEAEKERMKDVGGDGEIGSSEEKKESGKTNDENESEPPPSPFLKPHPLITSPESSLRHFRDLLIKRVGNDKKGGVFVVRMGQDEAEAIISPVSSDDELGRSLEEMKITPGDQLFLEFCDEEETSDSPTSKVIKYFDEFANKISISMNRISWGEEEDKKKDDEGEEEGSTTAIKVYVDMRCTLRELREVIAQELGLEEDGMNFKIKRAELGAEVKALDLNLTALNIGDGHVIWLEKGQALLPDEFSMKIVFPHTTFGGVGPMNPNGGLGEEDGEKQTFPAGGRGDGTEEGKGDPEDDLTETDAMKHDGDRFEQIGSIIIKRDMMVREVRELILNQMTHVHELRDIQDPMLVRLRECTLTASGAHKMTTVLCPGLPIAGVMDLKDDALIAAQILREPEEFSPNHFLLKIQRWFPERGVLDEGEELAFDENISFDEFTDFLSDKMTKEKTITKSGPPPKRGRASLISEEDSKPKKDDSPTTPSSSSHSNSPLPPVVPDETVVTQLVSMGFDRDVCEKGAVACHNSVDLALDWVLSYVPPSEEVEEVEVEVESEIEPEEEEENEETQNQKEDSTSNDNKEDEKQTEEEEEEEEEDGDEGTYLKRSLRLVKPWSWQLKEWANIPLLKWGIQPSATARLTGAPWRLQHGDTVLFKDGREREVTEGEEGEEDAFKVYVPTPEVGFKIYTPEEQKAMREEKKREEEERTKLLEDKMKRIAEAIQEENEG